MPFLQMHVQYDLQNTTKKAGPVLEPFRSQMDLSPCKHLDRFLLVLAAQLSLRTSWIYRTSLKKNTLSLVKTLLSLPLGYSGTCEASIISEGYLSRNLLIIFPFNSL